MKSLAFGFLLSSTALVSAQAQTVVPASVPIVRYHTLAMPALPPTTEVPRHARIDHHVYARQNRHSLYTVDSLFLGAKLIGIREQRTDRQNRATTSRDIMRIGVTDRFTINALSINPARPAGREMTISPTDTLTATRLKSLPPLDAF